MSNTERGVAFSAEGFLYVIIHWMHCSDQSFFWRLNHWRRMRTIVNYNLMEWNFIHRLLKSLIKHSYHEFYSNRRNFCKKFTDAYITYLPTVYLENYCSFKFETNVKTFACIFLLCNLVWLTEHSRDEFCSSRSKKSLSFSQYKWRFMDLVKKYTKQLLIRFPERIFNPVCRQFIIVFVWLALLPSKTDEVLYFIQELIFYRNIYIFIYI